MMQQIGFDIEEQVAGEHTLFGSVRTAGFNGASPVTGSSWLSRSISDY